MGVAVASPMRFTERDAAAWPVRVRGALQNLKDTLSEPNCCMPPRWP